jgi:hypothetical protein
MEVLCSRLTHMFSCKYHSFPSFCRELSGDNGDSLVLCETLVNTIFRNMEGLRLILKDCPLLIDRKEAWPQNTTCRYHADLWATEAELCCTAANPGKQQSSSVAQLIER